MIDSPTCWISPVRGFDERTVEDILRELLEARGVYALGDRAPARRSIGEGDRICFYAAGIGVVGHAVVASKPERRDEGAAEGFEHFPWVFGVKEVRLYPDDPVAFDAALRQRLEALRGREGGPWSWLVHTTGKLSPHDFRVVTRQ